MAYVPMNRSVFAELGFRRAPIHVYPELSWVLDITPDEEALLSGMKKNTRYGIRKGERDGVTITSSGSAEDFESFWKIYVDTANRQSFVPHPRRLVKGEFEEFAKSGRARIYFAHHDGKPISTAFIVYGAQSAFYHHGASLPHTAITPGEALQWQIIRDAKAHGLSRYNFWGVVPEGEKEHAWARLDKFKRGFGGAEEAYVPAQDYPLSWRYAFLFAIETVRRWKRRV
jgi:lipid II:glycine glycyltransferase (peptidoglycan interpeptide bridge formation enzyme)